MRIIIGVAPDQDPAALADTLRQQGAQYVHEPTAALPDVIVADFGDIESQQLVQDVQQLPGVRYAELDAMRTISE
jgi:hypothetical protein